MRNLLYQLIFDWVMIILAVKDIIVNFFLLKWIPERKRCPPLAQNENLCKSAIDLASMIRNKEITSYEVVKGYIDRLIQVNPVINAIIDGPFVEALDEAKLIDERIARDQISEEEFQQKPFLGVPCSIKDSFMISGKLHTLGLAARKSTRATETAEAVKLLQNAGAIAIVTTSTPELNKWMETFNNIIGTTNNPYDSRRSAGGSSGGEAAVVSACGSAFGLGSDIGGSIRIPSAHCGIFGHKPTTNTISLKGLNFRTGEETSSMVCIGPMSRHSKDLTPLLKILVRPEKLELLKLDESVDTKQLKYYYITSNGSISCSPIDDEIQGTMNQVLSYIRATTNEHPRKIENLTGLSKSFKLSSYWIFRENEDIQLLYGNGVKTNFQKEFWKYLKRQCQLTFPSLIVLLLNSISKSEKTSKEMIELTKKMDEELAGILGDNGVLLFPSGPLPPKCHYHQIFSLYNVTYTSIFNVLRYPVTQIPISISSEGLPLGIQVVATKNRDRHCLAVAQELEKAFGGWQPPFTQLKIK